MWNLRQSKPINTEESNGGYQGLGGGGIGDMLFKGGTSRQIRAGDLS